MITRRQVLAGAAAGLGPETARRVASLDYGLAQTAVALGAAVVGLPDPADYARWVVAPALPDRVQDLGQRTQPNLDVLRGLRPELILAVPDHEAIKPLLERIAPVLMLPIATAARRPWAQSALAAEAIAAALGLRERLVGEVTAHYAAARDALADRAFRPLLLASFADPRHLTVYGPGCILHDGLDRLGLRNAWTGPVGRWGSATVPLEMLAAQDGGMLDEAALFVIEPVPPDVAGALAESPLWRALPMARAGRVATMPPVLMYGTLPAAGRFASLLVPRLLGGAARV